MTTKCTFRPDQLKILAKHLLKYKSKPAIQVIDKISPLYNVQEEIHKNIPVFIGVFAELIDLFPNEWFLSENGQYYWKKNKDKNTLTSVCTFFGINLHGFTHLFIPGGQIKLLYSGKLLNINSSFHDVGYNMALYVKTQELTLTILKNIEELHNKN